MEIDHQVILGVLLLACLVGSTALSQGNSQVIANVFTDANSPLAVGNAKVQATVAISQHALTGEQQYSGGLDGFVLGFMATVPDRDTDGDGVADPSDADSDGDGVGDGADSRPYDTDNDGWNNLNDPDDDNDGQSDHDEAIAGTNPLDSDSLFRIGGIEVLPNGDLRLLWDGVFPRSYSVYTTEDLVLVPPWDYQGATNAITTAPIQYTIPGPSSNRFFRVGVSW